MAGARPTADVDFVSNRWDTRADSTASDLYLGDEDGELLGSIIEDQYQDGPKVPGETCVDAGRYRVALRTDSPKFAHYYDRFEWYRGMPWLQDVPHFTFIYVHPGKNDDSSAGCLITAGRLQEDEDGEWEAVPGTSVPLFKRVCLLIYEALDEGEEVWWEIRDDEVRL